MKKLRTGTFSILAMSVDSRLMGVAVASGSTFVGWRVPHAKPGVGVIATQAFANIDYGIIGLELMTRGLSPKEVLDSLLMKDADPEHRQVAIMDFKGRKAVFTGSDAPEWRGEIIGEDYIVIGNLLFGKKVVSSMARQFQFSMEFLPFRMAKTLQVGSESGGDRRGERSAALILVNTENVKMNIRVDEHDDPVDELSRRLRHKCRKSFS